jgi:hypothetical protein
VTAQAEGRAEPDHQQGARFGTHMQAKDGQGHGHGIKSESNEALGITGGMQRDFSPFSEGGE